MPEAGSHWIRSISMSWVFFPDRSEDKLKRRKFRCCISLQFFLRRILTKLSRFSPSFVHCMRSENKKIFNVDTLDTFYGQRTPQTARDSKSFNRALRENTGESAMFLAVQPSLHLGVWHPAPTFRLQAFVRLTIPCYSWCASHGASRASRYVSHACPARHGDACWVWIFEQQTSKFWRMWPQVERGMFRCHW